jgi:hypothetical protein
MIDGAARVVTPSVSSTPEDRLAEVRMTADEADDRLDALLAQVQDGLREPRQEPGDPGPAPIG